MILLMFMFANNTLVSLLRESCFITFEIAFKILKPSYRVIRSIIT